MQTYHRPETVEAALQLLARSGVRTIAIAGGTSLNPYLDDSIDDVVDLQAVGLDKIYLEENQVTLGALLRLQTLVDSQDVPHLIVTMAQREGPNTFRNMATLGGVIAGADWESELIAALLVHEATLTIQSANGERQVTLTDFLADVDGALTDGLITAVSLVTGGQTASARLSRTPADRAIVAAAARRDKSGKVWLAFSGVAKTPILFDPVTSDTTLTPPGDFRGSGHYRLQMALTLGMRVRAELQ